MLAKGPCRASYDSLPLASPRPGCAASVPCPRSCTLSSPIRLPDPEQGAWPFRATFSQLHNKCERCSLGLVRGSHELMHFRFLGFMPLSLTSGREAVLGLQSPQRRRIPLSLSQGGPHFLPRPTDFPRWTHGLQLQPEAPLSPVQQPSPQACKAPARS